MKTRMKLRAEHWKYIGLGVLAVAALAMVIYALSGDVPPMVDPKIFR